MRRFGMVLGVAGAAMAGALALATPPAEAFPIQVVLSPQFPVVVTGQPTEQVVVVHGDDEDGWERARRRAWRRHVREEERERWQRAMWEQAHCDRDDD